VTALGTMDAQTGALGSYNIQAAVGPHGMQPVLAPVTSGTICGTIVGANIPNLQITPLQSCLQFNPQLYQPTPYNGFPNQPQVFSSLTKPLDSDSLTYINALNGTKNTAQIMRVQPAPQIAHNQAQSAASVAVKRRRLSTNPQEFTNVSNSGTKITNSAAAYQAHAAGPSSNTSTSVPMSQYAVAQSQVAPANAVMTTDPKQNLLAVLTPLVVPHTTEKPNNDLNEYAKSQNRDRKHMWTQMISALNETYDRLSRTNAGALQLSNLLQPHDTSGAARCRPPGQILCGTTRGGRRYSVYYKNENTGELIGPIGQYIYTDDHKYFYIPISSKLI